MSNSLSVAVRACQTTKIRDDKMSLEILCFVHFDEEETVENDFDSAFYNDLK